MVSGRRQRGSLGGILFVFGDIALDVIVRNGNGGNLAASDVITGSITANPGGSAANCAVDAARLGAAVAFVGVTGRDPIAEWLVADLGRNGVDAGFVRQVDSGSAIVVAVEEPSGTRRMYSHRGPASGVPYGPLPADLLSRCRWLHLSGYSFQDEASRSTALALLGQATSLGCTVSLDPSFHSAQEFRANQAPVLRRVDVLLPNLEEAVSISGNVDPESCARAIHAMGPSTVVVKMGEAGCIALDEDEVYRVPSFSVEEVADTLGAGDAFCAGFICGRLWGLEVGRACVVANAVAACAVGQVGGHAASPTRPELIRFLEAHGQVDLAQELATH